MVFLSTLSKGIKGDTGDTGPQGNQGRQGVTGIIGPQGNQGNQGRQGNTGVIGPQGNQGLIGNTGDIGPQGNQGRQGTTGPIGNDSTVPGPQGNQGNQGRQGNTGIIGPQGNQGNQGIFGDTGAIQSPRITSTTSSTTPTPNADTTDMYILTALAANATFGAPTGTPVQAQKLIIRIKDNGTARTLGWNAIYRAVGVALPTTTVISKTLYLGFIYNSTDTRWDLVATALEA
jgi:hypothetical protein